MAVIFISLHYDFCALAVYLTGISVLAPNRKHTPFAAFQRRILSLLGSVGEVDCNEAA
jgi:hypothetical protein